MASAGVIPSENAGRHGAFVRDGLRPIQRSIRVINSAARNVIMSCSMFRNTWRSLSRRAALLVTLVYVAAFGGRLLFLTHEPLRGGKESVSVTRLDAPALQRERAIDAERRGIEAFFILLPWITLFVLFNLHNTGMLVLVFALNAATVYAIATCAFGRPRRPPR